MVKTSPPGPGEDLGRGESSNLGETRKGEAADMTEKRLKALEDEVQGLRSRVEKLEKDLAARVAALEKAVVPTEGELTPEKVREAALKGDVGPLMKWINKGYPTSRLLE